MDSADASFGGHGGAGVEGGVASSVGDDGLTGMPAAGSPPSSISLAPQSRPRQVSWEQNPAGRLLVLALVFEHLAQMNVKSMFLSSECVVNVAAIPVDPSSRASKFTLRRLYLLHAPLCGPNIPGCESAPPSSPPPSTAPSSVVSPRRRRRLRYAARLAGTHRQPLQHTAADDVCHCWAPASNLPLTVRVRSSRRAFNVPDSR